jgi:hypothetical protein
MVDDNSKDTSRETFERRIREAKETIENCKKLINRLTEPQPENADPQRKLTEQSAVSKVSRAPKPPPSLRGSYLPARKNFRPIAVFEYEASYPQSHRARVRLAELEAVEMDQMTGIRHIMAAYLAGVRECGTRAAQRWSADQVETDTRRFLQLVAISQGRTRGIWSEPDDDVEKALREMSEYRATIHDVSEAWIEAPAALSPLPPAVTLTPPSSPALQTPALSPSPAAEPSQALSAANPVAAIAPAGEQGAMVASMSPASAEIKTITTPSGAIPQEHSQQPGALEAGSTAAGAAPPAASPAVTAGPEVTPPPPAPEALPSPKPGTIAAPEPTAGPTAQIEIPAAPVVTPVASATPPPSGPAEPPDRSSGKGDTSLLGENRLVNRKTAGRYLDVGERQLRNLIKSGTLTVEGKGPNQKITSASLRKYVPPDAPKK